MSSGTPSKPVRFTPSPSSAPPRLAMDRTVWLLIAMVIALVLLSMYLHWSAAPVGTPQAWPPELCCR